MNPSATLKITFYFFTIWIWPYTTLVGGAKPSLISTTTLFGK
jgi:hypothetical protein